MIDAEKPWNVGAGASKQPRNKHPPNLRRMESAPAKLPAGAWAVYEQCPICCEMHTSIMCMEWFAGKFQSACHCKACMRCVEKWVELNIASCVANKQVRVRCFGCDKMMPQQAVLESSSKACQLAEQCDRRDTLKANPFFPEIMQVECRQMGCVGIGYLGYEHIMCMICEEQWLAAAEEVSHDGKMEKQLMDPDASAFAGTDGITILAKRCPKCGVLVEKNGGCDHMVCALCKHQYWWSTGKKYG